MPDLAKLVIACDSTQVVDGDRKMGHLASTTERAEAGLTKMNRVLAGLGVAAGIGLLAHQAYNTNAEFERLNTSLVTVTKSQDRANQVFGELTGFAARTPFQLKEVTDAYIMMRARGLDPTQETMTSLGNLASGMGRTFQDTIGAVGSLAAGEIEPMKQLGFSVMTIGDKVRISSGGVSESVQRNAYDISKAVARISDVKFAGGMERQINTLGGAWSNLQDQVDATLYKMGQQGMNANLVKGMQDVTQAINDATPALTSFASEAVNGSVTAVKYLTEHKNAVLALGAAYVAVKVGQGIGGIQQDYSTGTGDGIGAKARGFTDYVRSVKLAQAEVEAYAESEVRATQLTLDSAKAQLAKTEGINLVVVKTAQQIETDTALAAQESMVARALAARLAAQEALNVAMATHGGTLSTGGTSQQIGSAVDVTSVAQARMAAADASLKEEQAELRRLRTSQAANVVDFEGAAMERTRIMQKEAVIAAENAHSVAIDKQTVAKARNSAASTAGSLAAKGFSSVVTALGGPLGATVAALGVIAVVGPMAWEACKSSAQKASEESDKYLVRLREEVALLDRKKELQDKGRTGEAGLDDPTIKALQAKEKYAGELQSKLARASNAVHMFSGDTPSDAYISALQREQELQAALNKVLGEYNEIATKANRVKAEAAKKSAEAKAASEADAKAVAANAKKEMEEQKKAQEEAKRAEERKKALKELKDEVATFGMAKDAVERYKAAKLGLANTKEFKELQELKAIRRKDIADGDRELDEIQARRRASQVAFEENQAALQAEAEAYELARDTVNPLAREMDQLGKAYEALTLARNTPGGITDAEFAEGEARLIQGMQKVRLEQLRLKAESGSTWAIIGDVVAQNAGNATDAMVSWMNKTDGLARTWESLGDTVRNVIADMCVQMQKAILQQQAMQPFMSWIGTAIGLGSNTSNTNPWGGSLYGSANGGTEWIDAAPSGSGGLASIPVAKSSAGSVSSVIQINVQSDGTSNTKVTSSNANAMAQDLQRSVEPMVLQVIAKHMRPGGRLNPVAGGGIA